MFFSFKISSSTWLSRIALAFLVVTAVACGGSDGGGNDSSGDNNNFDSDDSESTRGVSTTVFTSSHLAVAPQIRSVSSSLVQSTGLASGPSTLQTDLSTAQATPSTAQSVETNCTSPDAIACVTPSAVSGKSYYAGVMVGRNLGYSVGPILGDVIDPSQATSYVESDLHEFDLAQGIQTPGSFTCCDGSPFPSDEEAFVTRLEIYFGYIDTTFILGTSGIAEALQGTHTVRLVFADITDTDLRRGDLLYQSGSSGDFVWCTTDSGCTHSTRPDTPIQLSSVSTFVNDSFGSPTIPTVAAELTQDHEDIQLTRSQLEDSTNAWTFTADFQINQAVIFTSDPSTWTSTAHMIAAYDLAAQPGRDTSGFSVNLTVTVEDNPNGTSGGASNTEDGSPDPIDLNGDGTIDLFFDEQEIRFGDSVVSVEVIEGDGILENNVYTFNTESRIEFIITLTTGQRYRFVGDPSVDDLEDALQVTPL